MHEQTITFSVDAGLKDVFTQEMRQQQYDAWFTRKVEAGLHELQEGKVLSHEEANSHVEAFKATLRSGQR